MINHNLDLTIIENFLSHLSNLEIKLWVENDRLCYRAPKENLTPEILATMKARKEELLIFLKTNQTLFLEIKPVCRNKILPLSFAQERLWFLDQLEDNKTIYNLSSTLRLEGNLDILAVEKAFSTLIQRHEVLRTCFQSKNGIPYQVISPKIDFKLPVIDLTSLSLNEQNKEIEKLAKQEALTPFDLTKPPLIRVKIWQLSLTIHILIITIHHIIYDGWSSGILKKELSSLYSAYIQKELNPLPDLSIQYADFAFWQKKYLQGEVLNYHLNYWKNQLKDVPFLLELPLDFPRPPQQTYQGKSIKIKISTPLTNQLRQLSKKLNVTLFMIMLSAFSILLYRYSNQKNLVIGTPIANRTLTEIEPLIGFFANTLALRVSCENNLKFTELLQQVKQTTLNAYTYQKIPFEKLVEVLQIEHSLSYNPLFQVMFAWQNMPKETLNFGDITITSLNFEHNITQFDLDLTLTETEDYINGYIKYNTNLFNSERIHRMVEHFHILLQAIVENPEQKISQLPLLSESEKSQLLVDWNPPENYENINKCIHQLFEEQATKTPHGIAIKFKQEYSIKKEDKILQFASLSFDTAAEEIYPCLCSGATLILPTDEWLTIPRFLEYCQQFDITILDLPTAYWHQMIADLADNNWQFPPTIRLVIIGGEKAQSEYVKIWQKKVGDYPQLINTYGPTETTIVATKYVLNSSNIDGKLPIGKPLSYVSTYVLDSHFQLVPIGVDGELYLGGKGLAKGYLNQPKLTEEKFITNPFNPQTKLYKTGDKVRYLPDGNLEFIGRIDNQVKIRGFRIELEEIETVIMQYFLVKQALVISHTNNDKNTFLVAYIVSKNKQDNCEDLAHFLKEKLPQYMIPSLFIELDYLPITSNGKIDYNQLPKPDFNEVYKSSNFVFPRNDLEKQLSEIWLEILELNKLSIKDNFFTLGGHSLLAVKLMSEIERKLGINLPISLIFKAGNIEDLAQEINRIQTTIYSHKNYDSLVLMKQGNHNINPLFLIHPIGGEVFCYNDLVSYLDTERSCYGLTYPNVKTSPKYQSIEDLASTYLDEIKKIQNDSKYLLGGWSYGGLISFEMAKQLNKQGKNIELLILIEPSIPSGIKQTNENLLFIDFIANLTLNKDININNDQLKLLPIAEQVKIVLKQLKENNILPQQYKLSKFQEQFTIFKHNVEAISKYEVQNLTAEILLFKSPNYSDIAINFWTEKIKGNLTIYEILGNHFTIMTQSNAMVLAEYLQQKIMSFASFMVKK